MSGEEIYDRVTALRVRAQDAANCGDPGVFAAMADELRTDGEWWPTVWSGLCALRTAEAGRPAEARALLDEALAVGFCQPELLEPDFSAAFAGLPDWPDLVARMAANIPPPPVELLAWPMARPTLPLQLDRLPPEREEMLLARLPRPLPSAWDTALSLMEWTTGRWKHANNRTGVGLDAVKLLEAVDDGQRFRCVEYSTVLTQALNAVGIPARGANGFTRHHHVGTGRGHRFTEAWIDDHAGWVVLDGQNGLYWHDDGGRPLGLAELLARHRAGSAPAGHVALRETFTPAQIDVWWSYFAKGQTGRTLLSADWITADPAPAYPDLAQVTAGLAAQDGGAVLRFHSRHPYAEGFAVDGVDGDEHWTPPPEPGEHTVDVRVRTRYGVVPGSNRVTVRVN